MLMRVVTLWMVLAAGHVAAEQAQDTQIGGVGIAVFSDSDYRGRNATFRSDTQDLGPYDLNDRISSLRVAPGELWEVCEHPNYGGRCQVFSGGEPDLGRSGWSDAISSLRRVTGGGGYPPIQPKPGGIELFSNTRFRGERRFLTDAVSDLRRMGFDNDAESLRLDSREPWEVCVDANFRNCRVVNSDVTDLDDIGLSERVSSVRPSDPGDGRPPYTGEPQRLVLFDDRQYRGRAFNVDDDMPSLSGFSNRAESVQVFGGVWELCEETRYRGRCVSVTANVADLAALGLRNRVKSVRPR